jgi:hypothetical protein
MLEVALTGQVLLWLIIVGLFLASGQATIFHPLTCYLGFHGVVFVIRPLLVHYLHFDALWQYMLLDPTDANLIKTLAVSSTALMVFAVCCFGAGYSPILFPATAPAPFSVAQQKALLVTTLLLGPVVLYSIHVLTHGGLQGKNLGGTFILTGASGYTVEAQFMAGPLLCAWLTMTRFNWVGLLPTLVYLAYRSYAGWNRWTIVLFFLALSGVYAWQKRIRWLPRWSILLAIPVYFLFHTLGVNRDYFHQLMTGEQPPPLENTEYHNQVDRLRAKYDTQEFANFDYLCYVLTFVPDRTGTYSYGSQYLQLFTEPIPRALWKGKPVGAPVGFFNLNNYGNFLGLTVSLPGDGWISGGWAGVIITMGLVGCLAGLAHRWFWRHITNNMAALFYIVGLAMLPQWYRDGGISIAKFLFWNLSPLILWLVLTWMFEGCGVPGVSHILRGGTAVRFMHPKENVGRS